MDYSRISLAFCKLRLRRGSEIMSRSEASKRLLALRNQGSSKERRELESQLREDALFQSRMEELHQSILPRLGEILRELLRCRRPISLPNESRAQLAINILCDEILSKGQMNAQHFIVYVDGDHETADRQEFTRWQKQKIERAQQESSTRVAALRERVESLEATLATSANRRKLEERPSRGSQTPNGDFQKKIKKLENERAADRLKIIDLEKQQVDNLTTLNAAKVEFERVRSELQRVLKERESEQEATKAELDSVCSDLRRVRRELAKSKEGESMQQADLEAAKVELEAVRSELKCVQTELDKERHNSRNGIHEYQTTLDARKAELEHSNSELQRMRTELDAERDRSTKAESEVANELKHVHSELKHAQTELKAERGKSTEAAFKHQANMQTAKVELKAVRSELKCVQTELDKERHNSRNGIHEVNEYQTTLDARKAELEHSNSELQRMRTELDTERDRSTKAESELKTELGRALSMTSEALCRFEELEKEMKELKNTAVAIQNAPHQGAMKSTFDGEALRREGRESVASESLMNPEWEQSTSALPDTYGSSAPASPSVPAFGPEPASAPLSTVHDSGNRHNRPHVVARPLKTPRRSTQHTYATQPEPDAFKIEYVGPLKEELQPPEPPEGNSWLEYYTQHGLAKLSEAQSTKARCQAVTLRAICRDCVRAKLPCLHRAVPPRVREGKNSCINCLLSTATKCNDIKPDDTVQIDDTYPFRAQAVREAVMKFHNAAVSNRKVPGRWMGNGVDEFTAKYVPPPVIRRPRPKVNPNDRTAAVASMVQPVWTVNIE